MGRQMTAYLCLLQRCFWPVVNGKDSDQGKCNLFCKKAKPTFSIFLPVHLQRPEGSLARRRCGCLLVVGQEGVGDSSLLPLFSKDGDKHVKRH